MLADRRRDPSHINLMRRWWPAIESSRTAMAIRRAARRGVDPQQRRRGFELRPIRRRNATRCRSAVQIDRRTAQQRSTGAAARRAAAAYWTVGNS